MKIFLGIDQLNLINLEHVGFCHAAGNLNKRITLLERIKRTM